MGDHTRKQAPTSSIKSIRSALDTSLVAPYVVVQFVGAMLAGLVLQLLFTGDLTLSENTAGGKSA